MEATGRVAKADLVPTSAKANLLPSSASFAELAGACERFCELVNAREHRSPVHLPASRPLCPAAW